jgi:uracil-DNA glycosylase
VLNFRAANRKNGGDLDSNRRARVASWLTYFNDLNLGPYYRDRAVSESLTAGNTPEPQIAAATAAHAPAAPISIAARQAAAAASKPAPATTKPVAAPFIQATAAASLFEIVDKVENDSLEKIRADLGECTRCRLHKGRTKLVFGVGNPKAELVFVGEGPGHDEDIQGEPFVGRAGKLLTQMIEAMGLRRQDVYICNVVKCRPPDNRLPEKDEIAICSPFLMRQLDAIHPKVICALGACAAQTLLETTQGITRFRGQWFDFRNSKLIATYHPAYLLRNPPAKSEVWKDLQKVMAILGLEAPKKR